MSFCKHNVCPSTVTIVPLVGVPGPDSRAGHRVQWPKKSTDFLLHVLKIQSNAELKGLDVDYPVSDLCTSR